MLKYSFYFSIKHMFISMISYRLNDCFVCVLTNFICAVLFTQHTSNYYQTPSV